MIKRIFVEKKAGFDVKSQKLFRDLKDNLGISGLEKIRIFIRYDIEGVTDEEFFMAKKTIFSEPPIDSLYEETLPVSDQRLLAIEYLPGQYDQRADSAAQCLQIITKKEKPIIRTAIVYVMEGIISDMDFLKIKQYLINPVDSREADNRKPDTLHLSVLMPQTVEIIDRFIQFSAAELENFRQHHGLAMSLADITYCQQYFSQENRNPTITEIKVLDTYWSDHCRHTTFTSRIESVQIMPGHFTFPIQSAYLEYLQTRSEVYGPECDELSLMQMATLGVKALKKAGKLEDMEISGEINACSIVRPVDCQGETEEWLIMFKNETHNHPTEIEPFGGAATCLGGAIRDPLSGRAFVYQAMRVTGSGDPRQKISDTISGKLPQKKITTEAALGFSSYGNQIGLATGLVHEIYHSGYMAKRMEVGAVIGAVARKHIKREEPKPGDVILYVGGKTGRDGIGGATGSSKVHNEDSIVTAGAEVQKGNAPEERKLQRLFRHPHLTAMIKKCNDFGAGGVSVAIGELADGLKIYLDRVPRKYEGLDGTELALSESQERMAVVLAANDAAEFIKSAHQENLQAVEIAKVTDTNRLEMFWNNCCVVNLKREFIDTHGVRQHAKVIVTSPFQADSYFTKILQTARLAGDDLQSLWLDHMSKLSIACQKGLVEQFDCSIGAGSVFFPFGGKYQLTPAEVMVAKIPVYKKETTSGTIMAFGFNPDLSLWSPFHGGVYAVLEAVAKIVAGGGNYSSVRLSLQEYFEKLGQDAEKWGKPFAALLGADYAMKKLGIAAIGGKDSMSGTFKDLNVPPTLIAFAVTTVDVAKVVSPEFKENTDSVAIWLETSFDDYDMPDFVQLIKNFELLHDLIEQGKILAAHMPGLGGIAAGIGKMCLGNGVGFSFSAAIKWPDLVKPRYGSFILQLAAAQNIPELFKGCNYKILGKIQAEPKILLGNTVVLLNEMKNAWQQPLEKIFPTNVSAKDSFIHHESYRVRSAQKPRYSLAKPRVIIPVFPGSNCEYDSETAFERAGAAAESFVFRNLFPEDISGSLKQLAEKISQSQIIMIPGGFSSGDEPDGSGKFIAAVFRNPYVTEEVLKLIHQRDGLILGVCNGFQALVKLGLVPFGDIRDMKDNSPTLTFNTIGRHVSCMARTKVVSVLSPWFLKAEVGDIHAIPISHGEGRFIAEETLIVQMFKKGQVAAQYVDLAGNPTMDIAGNPNGSLYAIEAITSPDGRILGKMAHSERIGNHVARNIPGNKNQPLFESAVYYFS